MNIHDYGDENVSRNLSKIKDEFKKMTAEVFPSFQTK